MSSESHTFDSREYDDVTPQKSIVLDRAMTKMVEGAAEPRSCAGKADAKARLAKAEMEKNMSFNHKNKIQL